MSSPEELAREKIDKLLTDCGWTIQNRFADLVPLVRFALEEQPVLKPFADSVTERFHEWLMDKAKAGTKFTLEQLAWLNLIRDHIATSVTIEPSDLELAPFNKHGDLAKHINFSAVSFPNCSINSTTCS